MFGKTGELVGIGSEGDLIRRPEIGATKRHSWWLELVPTKLSPEGTAGAAFDCSAATSPAANSSSCFKNETA
jgi:hypothetical protein